MALFLYNSLTKKEENVEAFLGARKEVSMYTCGPTVYSRPHIGNYSSFLMADLLRRWLEVKGYTVKHVKNITDVGHLLHDADQGDDKIQQQAEKEQLHPLEIAKRYTEQYLEDERTLNMLEPSARPRATEYIEQMKEMIGVLLEKGIAYVTEDGIYFDVMKFPQYGTLSGNTLENVASGARVEVNEQKKHPADFALWKFCVGNNAHHVLRWSSPRADMPEGFPGWHIECSAMSAALLGEQIDIHTGGEDNIFPHHECEIAQSESCTGKSPFVRFWLHKRRIDLAGEKMSKSLGNVLNIPDILAKGYAPQDLRYYLLSVHYRTNLKFSWKGMDDAKKARGKIMEWMDEIETAKNLSDAVVDEGQKKELLDMTKGFEEFMDRDLNTSGALGTIFNIMTASRVGGTEDAIKAVLSDFIDVVSRTFGCFEPEEESIPADVQSLVAERASARAAKNFSESDRLRDELLKRGYEVRDTSEGQTVKKL